MAVMFGNGSVYTPDTANGNSAYIMRTEKFRAECSGTVAVANAADAGWESKYTSPAGKKYAKINPKFYADNAEQGTAAAVATLENGQDYFCSYDLAINGSVIEVSANAFPGTYYVTGDTYARSETSGEDEFFQFIIPKAKVTSENTITLEAEGDPSVFNMNLTVLRPADGIMMKLVKYELNNAEAASSNYTSVMVHNHELVGDDAE